MRVISGGIRRNESMDRSTRWVKAMIYVEKRA